MVTPAGEVQRLWKGKPLAGSLQHHEAQRLLLKLGNVVVASGTTKWADDASKQLKQDLQVRGSHSPGRFMPCNQWPKNMHHIATNMSGATL